MSEFVAARAGGFHLRLAADHANLLDCPSFMDLLGEARAYSIGGRRQGLFREVRQLTEELRVLVKAWQPRRELHRLRTLWQASRPEREGRHHARFARAGLPVPELVCWGVRRFPSRRFGLYLAGLVVMRWVEGLRDLSELRRCGERPWAPGGPGPARAVLAELAGLLARVHGCGLIHGDYMLKNVGYTPDGRLWILDLGSGWPLPAGDPEGGRGRHRDLLRAVLSLARNGMGREDVLAFLECYLREREGEADAAGEARRCLERCLALPDRRAEEAAALLGRT